MPLTVIQGIFAVMAALTNRSGYHIVSETPNESACSIVEKGQTFKELFEHGPFGGGKWIRYQCVEGKGSRIEFEIVASEQHRKQQQRNEMGLRAKRMRDRLRRARDKKDRTQS